MSTMTPCSAVVYYMTEGGTITVSKNRSAKGGWDLAFGFGSDASLDFTEHAASVPEWMSVVKDYCGWPAQGHSVD